MIDYVVGVIVLIGSLFIFISSIGLIKMPDIYLRMSATTKAATLGVGSVLLGAALFFGDIGSISRAVAIILFLILTAPIAAHMIGRASYLENLPMWKGTHLNELEKYNKQK